MEVLEQKWGACASGVNNGRPTIRACIMLGRIGAARKGSVSAHDPAFRDLCHDILNADCVKVTHDGKAAGMERLDEIMIRCCPDSAPLPTLVVDTHEIKLSSGMPRVKNIAPASDPATVAGVNHGH